MIFVTSGVHGFGMDAPVRVVWLDDDGQVLAVDTLVRRGILRRPGARFALELPTEAPAPRVGSVVRLAEDPAGSAPIVGTWPGPSSSVARRSAT